MYHVCVRLEPQLKVNKPEENRGKKICREGDVKQEKYFAKNGVGGSSP